MYLVQVILVQYMLEQGLDIITAVYLKVLLGDLKIVILWNIGKGLRSLRQILSERRLSKEDYKLTRIEFLNEILKMLKLEVLKLVPLEKTKTWTLIEKHHIYEADASPTASSFKIFHIV